MLLATLLLAVQPGGSAPAPDPHLACAPVQNLTAAGPRPPVLHAQRMEISPEARVTLSVHNCPDGGFRVERRRQGPRQQEVGDVEWVPAAQCPALRGWIDAATRFRLPAPMLTEHRSGSTPPHGTWFTLNAGLLAGAGSLSGLELEILEPPGARPDTLSLWFREGERLFQTCRDAGHGGTGYLPFRRRLRP